MGCAAAGRGASCAAASLCRGCKSSRAARTPMLRRCPTPLLLPQALEVASLSKVNPGATKVIVMDNSVRC